MGSSGVERLGDLPPTTRWYRAHGRQSRRDKAARQQYLSPREEQALADYVLRKARSGYPLPVKSLRNLAQSIRRQRNCTIQSSGEDTTPAPNKNWPQGFYKRHPGLRARRVKAIDQKRHEHAIYEKVAEWFEVIGGLLKDADILQENVYNMDETNFMLSMLGSLKVVVGRDCTQTARPACVQRTSVTSIECISADGRYLDPLIIWPAATHRSTWTTHPTPGWHFAHSKSGYTDTAISLGWVQRVFDPSTKARAKGRPRVLISDGFGSHESLEVLTHCFQNNIILCRLPSHTSHKLQPCDVGVFGPLKTSYREQVERFYRGGANTISKQHFTSLYSKARPVAFTERNIRSSWAKAGLFPFNPERVLGNMQQPVAKQVSDDVTCTISLPSPSVSISMRTPTNFAGFEKLRTQLASNLDVLDEESKVYLQKLGSAAEKAFTDRALLFDENKLLFEQNNEKNVRERNKATMVGRAKVMSYEDILAAQQKRNAKETKVAANSVQTTAFVVPTAVMLSPVTEEVMQSKREVAAMGLAQYCNVLV